MVTGYNHTHFRRCQRMTLHTLATREYCTHMDIYTLTAWWPLPKLTGLVLQSVSMKFVFSVQSGKHDQQLFISHVVWYSMTIILFNIFNPHNISSYNAQLFEEIKRQAVNLTSCLTTWHLRLHCPADVILRLSFSLQLFPKGVQAPTLEVFCLFVG